MTNSDQTREMMKDHLLMFCTGEAESSVTTADPSEIRSVVIDNLKLSDIPPEAIDFIKWCFSQSENNYNKLMLIVYRGVLAHRFECVEEIRDAHAEQVMIAVSRMLEEYENRN